MAEKIDTSFVINTPEGLLKDNDRGCTERIKRLRRLSHSTQPHLDLERAKIETDVYKEYEGSVSVPVLRALVLKEYFSKKTLYLGDDELLVGEKGKDPQCSPTFPELCCHTIEDMHIMNDRKLVNFTVTEDDLKLQEEEIIPYWKNREIYSYGAKFGAMGWISGLTIGIGFALFAFLTFEICRIYKVYDYKNYIKQVIGPLWPMMDILTVLIAILLIAVMAAATGSIFEQVGLPNILGSVVIVLICGLLNFKGSKVIEKFESIGTILLYSGYILFTILVLVNKGGNISHVFSTMDTSTYDGSVTVPLCIYTGILYVAYNINAIPMGMFSLTRQTKRKETFISGLIAGLLMVIPWFLSYFAMMCFYGDTSIVGADVTTPWMEMIKAVNGGPALMALFSLVMGWTLVETATGCIHMIIDRFDVAMEEKGAAKLSDTNRGLITVITLIAALVLSRVGVVTLIEQGYSYLSYGFILFYLLPTLLVGGYKIIKHKDK